MLAKTTVILEKKRKRKMVQNTANDNKLRVCEYDFKCRGEMERKKECLRTLYSVP